MRAGFDEDDGAFEIAVVVRDVEWGLQESVFLIWFSVVGEEDGEEGHVAGYGGLVEGGGVVVV